jgi:hypothetical protein
MSPVRFNTTHAAIVAIATVASLWALPGYAGRPMTVDDANVNDVGEAHVETWLERQADGSRLWTVAPAYGLAKGVEIGASAARDTTNRLNNFSLQAKFRLTPSQENGCNTGAVIGIAQTRGGAVSSSVNTPYLNGLLTCNLPAGALHMNLGANRTAGGSTLTTWGIAFERGLGAITAHVEYFGQTHSTPTFQIGARTDIAKNIQIDATLGRNHSTAVFSLGLKLEF